MASSLLRPGAVCLHGQLSSNVNRTQRHPRTPRRQPPLTDLTWGTYVHTVGSVVIDWDPNKAEANFKEHGGSFAEAATVLTDDYALTREDQDSIGERRFISLGMSATGAMLVVVFTLREPDIYRLISSWKANKPQRKQYEKGHR